MPFVLGAAPGPATGGGSGVFDRERTITANPDGSYPARPDDDVPTTFIGPTKPTLVTHPTLRATDVFVRANT